MNKWNSMEAVDKTNLSEQTKLRLDEISKIENYFIEEINQGKSCNKKLSKYIDAFDYMRSFNYFKCKNWRSIDYFIYNYCWCTSWKSKWKLYFNVFSINRINKKLIEYNKKKNGKA